MIIQTDSSFIITKEIIAVTKYRDYIPFRKVKASYCLRIYLKSGNTIELNFDNEDARDKAYDGFLETLQGVCNG